MGIIGSLLHDRWSRNWPGFLLGWLGALGDLMLYKREGNAILLPPLPFILGVSLAVFLVTVPLPFSKSRDLLFRLAGRAIPDLTFLAALGTSYFAFLCLFGFFSVWILGVSVMVLLLVLFNFVDATVQAAGTRAELTRFEKAGLALCCLGIFGGIVYATAFPAFS